MKKNDIMKNLAMSVKKFKFKTKKNSPEILIIVGITGVITSTVMACVASTKLPAVLEDAEDDVQEIKSRQLDVVDVAGDVYDEDEQRKDLVISYAKTGVKIVGMYTPSVLVGALSIASIIASNNILRRRNAMLLAAYAAIDKSFTEYRKRVAYRFGDQVEKEIRYNVQQKEIEETVINEKGKEKKVKNKIGVVDVDNLSGYAIAFDERCFGYTRNFDLQRTHLAMCEESLNSLLTANGYLFLNEAYDVIGVRKEDMTEAGQIVGWNSKGDGDKKVILEIFEIYRTTDDDRYEKVLIVDFNVDGKIVDKVFTKNK